MTRTGERRKKEDMMVASQAERSKAVRGSQQISATQAEDLRWSAAQNHCVAMYTSGDAKIESV